MSKKSKTTTQKREIPAWLEAGSKQAVSLGQKIASRPYTPYEEQRVATFDPNEQQAYDLAQQGGQYREDLETSRTFAEQGAQSFLDADIEAYMNPFIKSALDPAAREVREENLRQQNLAEQGAGQAEAFGGSRATLLRTETATRGREALSDLYAEGYKSAFESAATRFDQDRVAARAASDQFRAIGAQGQRQLTQEAQTLLVTGGLKRSLEQSNLDFDYQQFIEARDWDITNLQPLLAALGTVPHGETATTETQTKGGEFQAILGAAATVTAAYFTGGMSLFGQAAGSALDPSAIEATDAGVS